jgi:hypothetical protein
MLGVVGADEFIDTVDWSSWVIGFSEQPIISKEQTTPNTTLNFTILYFLLELM